MDGAFNDFCFDTDGLLGVGGHGHDDGGVDHLHVLKSPSINAFMGAAASKSPLGFLGAGMHAPGGASSGMPDLVLSNQLATHRQQAGAHRQPQGPATQQVMPSRPLPFHRVDTTMMSGSDTAGSSPNSRGSTPEHTSRSFSPEPMALGFQQQQQGGQHPGHFPTHHMSLMSISGGNTSANGGVPALEKPPIMVTEAMLGHSRASSPVLTSSAGTVSGNTSPRGSTSVKRTSRVLNNTKGSGTKGRTRKPSARARSRKTTLMNTSSRSPSPETAPTPKRSRASRMQTGSGNSNNSNNDNASANNSGSESGPGGANGSGGNGAGNEVMHGLMEEQVLKRKRLARKAELARLSRRKKKMRLTELEEEVAMLKAQMEKQKQQHMRELETQRQQALQAQLRLNEARALRGNNNGRNGAGAEQVHMQQQQHQQHRPSAMTTRQQQKQQQAVDHANADLNLQAAIRRMMMAHKEHEETGDKMQAKTEGQQQGGEHPKLRVHVDEVVGMFQRRSHAAQHHLAQVEETMSTCLPLQFLEWLMTQNDKFYEDPTGLWRSLLAQELEATPEQVEQMKALRVSPNTKPSSEIREVFARFNQLIRAHLDNSVHTVSALSHIFSPEQSIKFFKWVNRYGGVCVKINL